MPLHHNHRVIYLRGVSLRVGDLTLAYESLQVTADTGLRLNAYVAEPGTTSADAMRLLASWATEPHPQPALDPDRS